MEYEFLPVRFQRILDLAGVVNMRLFQRMSECFLSLEEYDKSLIANDSSFSRHGGKYTLFFNSSDSYMNLDHVYDRNDQTVYRNLEIIPLTKDHLDELKNGSLNNEPLRLASLTISNSLNTPKFEMRVTDYNNGIYRLNSITHNNVLCFEYVLDLTYENGKYYVSTTRSISNCEDERISNKAVMSESFLRNTICVDNCYADNENPNKIFNVHTRPATDSSSNDKDLEDFIKGLFGL